MKALVVDDSHTIRRIFVNVLKKLFDGIEVYEAGNGQCGLAQFVLHKPDLILLDWNMPLMSGLELLQNIREKDKIVPVIMVTNEASKKNVVMALEAGATEYVVKPFSLEVIMAKVKKVIPEQSEEEDEEETNGSSQYGSEVEEGACEKTCTQHDPRRKVVVEQTKIQIRRSQLL